MAKASTRKILSKSFLDNNQSVDEDTATQLILRSIQKIRLVEEEKEADDQLVAAKNIAKELGSAYSSAIKYERAKIQYLLEKISEIQDGSVNPSSGANT